MTPAESRGMRHRLGHELRVEVDPVLDDLAPADDAVLHPGVDELTSVACRHAHRETCGDAGAARTAVDEHVVHLEREVEHRPRSSEPRLDRRLRMVVAGQRMAAGVVEVRLVGEEPQHRSGVAAAHVSEALADLARDEAPVHQAASTSGRSRLKGGGGAGVSRSSSTETSGSRRSSHAGIHHARRPTRRMTAGSRTSRTIVASRTTATVRPMPYWRRLMMSALANATKTPIMISAAPVITAAVLSRPWRIAASVSCVRSQPSRMRASRKTS